MGKFNINCLHSVYWCSDLSTVISVRVPRWIKEKLERYGVNIAEVVRRSLIEEIEKIEREEIEKQLDFLKEKLKGRIDPFELARIIDEERRRR